MAKVGEWIVAFAGAALTLVSIPLFFLNTFGGIVSGIWLMVLGHWGVFALGIFLAFSSSFAIGLVLTPASAAAFGGAALIQSKRVIAGVGLILIDCSWTYLVMTIWCAVIFAVMVAGARGHMVPHALWGYANAVAPWAFMASREQESLGSTVAVLACALGSAAMMVGVILLHAAPTVGGVLPFLLPFTGLGFVIQVALLTFLAAGIKAEQTTERVAGVFE